MRHTLLGICVALSVGALISGCAKKQTETVSSANEDSLIASNPVEPPSGSMTPQQPFEPMEAPQEPAPAPKLKQKPKHATAHEPGPQQAPEHGMPASASAPHKPLPPGVVVTWGSFLHVAVSDAISSENAHPGDAWSGTLTDSVMVGSGVAFPAGSVVHGTVKDAKPAKAGDRALLALEMTSVDAFGNSYPVSATMEPIVPGSPRARNVGAIVGGAVAGALIGNAVGGGKGSAVGGLVGGAAAGGAVARSKGYEAVLKPGDHVTFTLARDAVVRR